MDPQFGVLVEAATWVVAVAVIVLALWRSSGGGLVLAYVAHLWLLHWPAAAIYLLPWHEHYDATLVESGFRQSTYAIMAFGLGSVMLSRSVARSPGYLRAAWPALTPDRRFARTYTLAGLAAYFVLLPILHGVPTVTALVGVGLNVVVVGLALSCWAAWRQARRRALVGPLVAALILPALTVMSYGYLGYGAIAALAVLSFVAAFYRPRWKLVAVGLALGYLGMSVYVTYMRDRAAIREMVSAGGSLSSRIEQLSSTASTLEWFDPYDAAHLLRIDDRLNQNVLVGAAVRHLETGAAQLALGESLWQSVIAVIPRAIWLDKPVVAGSMGLVTAYTGIEFAEGTSVGLGQVLEFYMNFGTLGVTLGFLSLGLVMRLLDATAWQRLVAGDWGGFALRYLPALSLLQTGGSMVDVMSSAGAAAVVALLLNHALGASQRRPAVPAFR